MDTKEEQGIEFISSETPWGVDSGNNGGSSMIWRDPFGQDENTDGGEVDPAEENNNDGQEPLLEKDFEESVEGGGEEIPETPDIDNPIYFMAKQAAAEGLIPSDLEIPEDVGLDFVYEKYKESIVPIAQQQVIQEAEEKLKAAGISDENISLLQAIQNEVPVDEIFEITKYKKYSTLSDADDEEKIKVIKTWYQKRGLSEKEQERNINAITIDDEVDSEFESAKGFFENVVNDFEQEQQDLINQRQIQEAQIRQRNAQVLANLSTNFTIGEDKLSKDDAATIVSAVNMKQPVEFNGQVYNLSPYEQFFISLNNDFEFGLKVFKDFLLKDKKEVTIKNKLKEEVENDWLEAYKNKARKSSSTTSIKRKETETNTPIKTTTNTGGVYMEI